MKIGAMNNPHADLCKELEWIGKAGFDFVDLTIEPEKTQPTDVDVVRAKKIMKKHGLDIVGHMGDWMLPKDTGYDNVREAVKKEMVSAIRVLKRLGAKRITFHAPDVQIRDFQLAKKRHAALVKDLLSESKRLNVELMMENNSETLLDPRSKKLYFYLLKRFSALKVHIDVGHGNLCSKSNDTYSLMRKYGKRVKHFHFSDNGGGDDEHLSLGEGDVNWKRIVKFIKNKGYDGTITVEVFRSGKTGEKQSLKKLRKLWEAA